MNPKVFEKIEMPGVKNIIVVASGKGGGEKLAREFRTELLGQIPIVLEIGEVSDKGTTIYNQPDRTIIESFDRISCQINELVRVKI